MTDFGGFRLCGLAVVHPWLCDAMGHLTTRHYLGFFDDASYQLFAQCGYEPSAGNDFGWADVRHEIEYKSELQAGAVVRIVGRLTRLGKTSLTTHLRLLGAADHVYASLAATTVCFDLQERRARPLPDDFVEKARELFADL